MATAKLSSRTGKKSSPNHPWRLAHVQMSQTDPRTDRAFLNQLMRDLNRPMELV
jgi:hypothetical protein